MTSSVAIDLKYIRRIVFKRYVGDISLGSMISNGIDSPSRCGNSLKSGRMRAFLGQRPLWIDREGSVDAYDRTERRIREGSVDAYDRSETRIREGNVDAYDRSETRIREGNVDAYDRSETRIREGNVDAYDRSETRIREGSVGAYDRSETRIRESDRVSVTRNGSGSEVGKHRRAGLPPLTTRVSCEPSGLL